jgi:hypothetical protein
MKRILAAGFGALVLLSSSAIAGTDTNNTAADQAAPVAKHPVKMSDSQLDKITAGGAANTFATCHPGGCTITKVVGSGEPGTGPLQGSTTALHEKFVNAGISGTETLHEVCSSSGCSVVKTTGSLFGTPSGGLQQFHFIIRTTNH